MSYFVDVHTHLTDHRFASDLPEVVNRAEIAGLGAIVVNGLEPHSNREVMAMSAHYPLIKPALGIYPINGVWQILPKDLPFQVNPFDVNQEIAYIREQAQSGVIVAIGECGLDGHWVGADTFEEQERVFGELIKIAVEADIPVIVHSRKLEKRTIELLEFYQAKKVNFHCFCGKSKLAIDAAENFGWYFSIPANARKNELFGKMLRGLPMENILTETDAPYLAPEKGMRNEPRHVVGTVEYLAELRHISMKEAQATVWENFQRLFSRCTPG